MHECNMACGSAPSSEHDIWKAAAYMRLSHEDELKGESDSITGQRRMIGEWAQRKGDVQIVADYADDGWSGATLERPAFKQMVEDAKGGLFDTIVVKDLSRFGRSYLDCGVWIERELPKLGIRLYSIADDFDSMREWDFDTALVFPMKNLMNEMHVVATSQKVRASLAAKRGRGECVANYAPYGYCKDPHDRHRLIVDEEAAAVVRRIFESRAKGMSASEIARRLNRRGVPCPTAYRKQHGQQYFNGLQRSDAPKWHVQTVMRILRNEVYTGVLVQGRRRRISWRVHLVVPVDSREWSKHRCAHEAIVPVELFDTVNKMINGV